MVCLMKRRHSHGNKETHADVTPSELEELGGSAGLIRMSVGREHLSDLRRDLEHALAT